MRAAILAAGVGNRLGRPDLPPKVLLRFGGETLLARHVRLLRRFGVTRIDLAVGHRADAVAAEIARIGAEDLVACRFNPDFERGAIVSLWALAQAFRCGEPVIFMDGDVLYDHRMLARLIASPHANLDLHRKSGEHQLKQEVFDGTRDQVYGGVQARGGAPGSDQWPATG